MLLSNSTTNSVHKAEGERRQPLPPENGSGQTINEKRPSEARECADIPSAVQFVSALHTCMEGARTLHQPRGLIMLQKHRRQPREHEMPNASKTMADRLMDLRSRESGLEYSFPAENVRYESQYDHAKEIGHDH